MVGQTLLLCCKDLGVRAAEAGTSMSVGNGREYSLGISGGSEELLKRSVVPFGVRRMRLRCCKFGVSKPASLIHLMFSEH